MRKRRGGDDRLLAWKDGRRWRPVDSSLVNEYVGRTTGMEATAKDFRTWHATVIAAAALAEAGVPATKTARKRAVTAAMKEVSEFLGNTPALAGRRTSTPASWTPTRRGGRSRPRPGGGTRPPTRGRQLSSGPCCDC